MIVDEFACEPCKKKFKTEGMLKNHLQSKKHKDTMKLLKADVMLDQETERVIIEK